MQRFRSGILGAWAGGVATALAILALHSGYEGASGERLYAAAIFILLGLGALLGFAAGMIFFGPRGGARPAAPAPMVTSPAPPAAARTAAETAVTAVAAQPDVATRAAETAPERRYCTECGSANTANNQFCESCGKPLRG